MGLARFYVARVTPGELELDDAESNHASRVLRSQVGEDVLLFDGLGNEGFGTIRSIDRRRVVVEVASTRFAPRDHDGRLTLAVAMPKGDRQRNVIEKLVELGVDHLIPIETHRAVAVIDENASTRLARYMVEACKQSRRNRFLQIHPSVPWQSFLRNGSHQPSSRWILHPHPRGVTCEQVIFGNQELKDGAERESPRSLVFAIGPEGGFTDEEIQLAESLGFEILDLGERILRVETAVAFASVLGHLTTIKHRGDTLGPR
ncbi:MAG: RsmE family RNA methyltransferase [Planctomycetota bacterium]|jgi:16S rRNA (uracil1498-N3)-methyltransferase